MRVCRQEIRRRPKLLVGGVTGKWQLQARARAMRRVVERVHWTCLAPCPTCCSLYPVWPCRCCLNECEVWQMVRRRNEGEWACFSLDHIRPCFFLRPGSSHHTNHGRNYKFEQ